MKHRLGCVDRHAPPVRRTARGVWIAAAITPAAPVSGGGSVPFATRGSMASAIALVFGPIRISNFYDTSVCCHCAISFAHSKVHNGHKGGTPDRNTCWRDSPFEPPQTVCISACPALAVGRRVSSSDGKLTSGRARALEPRQRLAAFQFLRRELPKVAEQLMFARCQLPWSRVE
jgi:hypothetical protein